MAPKRCLHLVAALALLGAAFAGGRWWLATGQPSPSATREAASGGVSQADGGAAQTLAAPEPTDGERSAIARHLAAGRFEAAVAAYNRLDGDEQAAVHERGRRRILDKAQSLADARRHTAAIDLLSAFTRINHRDLTALMTLADVHRARGDHQAALDVLFGAGNAASQAYGRSEIEAVESAIRTTVQARASALTRASDREWLIGLYRQLVQKGYARPADRLELALHLKQAGRLRAARNTLAAIRHVPAVADEAAELERRIAQALQSDDGRRQRHDIDLQPRGEHFTAQVTVDGGPPMELLVDTGATLVAVSQSAARRSGLDQRQRLGQRSLQTANGVIEAEIVQARRLRVGELEIHEIAVAILPRSLDGVDGLLGMNALRGYDVRLDRQAQRLTLSPE